MHFLDRNDSPVLFAGVIAVGYINDVVAYILFYYIPGAAAQSEAFALADCMEPISFVLTYFPARLNFYDRPFPGAEMSFYEIIVIDFTEEADPL